MTVYDGTKTTKTNGIIVQELTSQHRPPHTHHFPDATAPQLALRSSTLKPGDGSRGRPVSTRSRTSCSTLFTLRRHARRRLDGRVGPHRPRFSIGTRSATRWLRRSSWATSTCATSARPCSTSSRTGRCDGVHARRHARRRLDGRVGPHRPRFSIGTRSAEAL